MVTLTGQSLCMEQVKRILWENAAVVACGEAMARVADSRRAVEKIVSSQEIVYGITTGFGKFSDVLIAPDDVETLQLNLIRSHACGIGEPFPEEVSRLMLIFRANALLKGLSGVRPVVVERLIDLVNHRIHPVVPQQGSLGASGDLAPLSHLALVLLGEGEAFYQGEKMSGNDALMKAGLEPLVLTAKEGLALINGTQAMTAQGVLNYLHAEQLGFAADGIAALTMEGLKGITDAFEEEIHIARGYPEQTAVAKRIRDYLQNSQLTTRQGELRVQDAYSLRCIPQVHGASWQALGYVKEKLEIEMNAATDNPLIFDGGKKVISGGNFHGQPIAFAMDFLKIAVAEWANISERRIERLVNPQLNDLPPFLSSNPGLESGAMIMQYAAASLVSENKTLAHPASVDSIPSSANQEDHVSMGTIGSRHCAMIIANTTRVLATEWICAMQAADYRGVELLSPRTKKVYELGRTACASIFSDRIFHYDMERTASLIRSLGWNDTFIGLEKNTLMEA
ncbi:histidine ammonia-lyase [Fictibacillus iocasae]|uniref:Histidine ammonia-lyase n=1 Tax=Fictibacillus iocasae TaxID=2715437 RepID=A0ABW2NL36_9BACL